MIPGPKKSKRRRYPPARWFDAGHQRRVPGKEVSARIFRPHGSHFPVVGGGIYPLSPVQVAAAEMIPSLLGIRPGNATYEELFPRTRYLDGRTHGGPNSCPGGDCLTLTGVPCCASREDAGFYNFAGTRALVPWGAALTYCTGQGAGYPRSRPARRGQ